MQGFCVCPPPTLAGRLRSPSQLFSPFASSRVLPKFSKVVHLAQWQAYQMGQAEVTYDGEEDAHTGCDEVSKGRGLGIHATCDKRPKSPSPRFSVASFSLHVKLQGPVPQPPLPRHQASRSPGVLTGQGHEHSKGSEDPSQALATEEKGAVRRRHGTQLPKEAALKHCTKGCGKTWRGSTLRQPQQHLRGSIQQVPGKLQSRLGKCGASWGLRAVW